MPLSRASSEFHKVWKANTLSICDAVLLRAIDCYDEACELLEAQERLVREGVELDGWADNYLGSPSLARSMPNADKAAIERARPFLQNSKRTLQELEDFNFDPLEPRTSPHPARRDLTHHKNMRFIKPCYGATTIATLAHMRMSLQALESWDMLDFFEVWDMMNFLVDLSADDYWLPRIGDGGHRLSRRIRKKRGGFEDLPAANWELAHMKLFALKVDFCSMPTNAAFKRPTEADIRYPFMAENDGEEDEELDWRTFHQCLRTIARGS